MTPGELRSICDSLNPGGQTKLAREIGVSPRTMRRWLAGRIPIPPLIEPALRGLFPAKFTGACTGPTTNSLLGEVAGKKENTKADALAIRAAVKHRRKPK